MVLFVESDALLHLIGGEPLHNLQQHLLQVDALVVGHQPYQQLEVLAAVFDVGLYAE